MKRRAVDLASSITSKHLITASVAVAMAVLALTYGGYGTDTLALLSVACWTVILVGLGFGFLPRTTLTLTSWVLLGLMAALTAWTVIAISWSEDAGLAYIKAIQVATALGVCVVVILASKPGEGRSWIAGVTIGLGVIIGLAALSRFIPGIGDDAELTRQLGPIMRGRLSWPLGYWNALGLATSLFMVLCLWHGGLARSERARMVAAACFPVGSLLLYLTASRGSIVAVLIGVVIVVSLGPGRRALVASLAVGLAGSVPLVLLASRLPEVVHAGTGGDALFQGLVLLVVTAAVCAAVAWARKPVLRRLEAANLNHKTSLRTGIGIGIVILIVLIALNPADRISSFTTIPVEGIEKDDSTYATQHLLSESGNGRSQLWETAIDAFKTEPIRGIGSGGFESYFKVNGSFWMKTVDPHSTPFGFLAELGLIGLLLLVSVVGYALFAGIRRYRALGASINGADEAKDSRSEISLFMALLAIGIFGFSIDWTGELPVMFGLMMICIAALAGPLYATPAPEREPKGRSILPVVAVVASMFLAGAVIIGSARQYEATSSIDASRSAIADGDGEKALDEAGQAVSATPWAGAAYAQLAAVQDETRDRPAALASAEEATRRSPKDDSYWLLLSDIQMRQRLVHAAVVSTVIARSLNPNSAYWYDKKIP